MPKAIFFDLDGTITDSGEGIINSAIYALEHFGITPPSREEMRVFVGPPLRDTFYRFGIPKDQLEEAIKVYRERYIPTGIFENHPYRGIESLLQALREQGNTLFVATSNPEWMAKTVLDRFDLSKHFQFIAGATMDGSRDDKSSVIGYLLMQLAEKQDTVMIGDTSFDVIGASAHGIPTIGVSWGYGSRDELLQAGAIAIADTPEELLNLLQ